MVVLCAEAISAVPSFYPEIANSTARSRVSTSLIYERTHDMTTGTVKWFNAQKGYGFIAPDNGGGDAFVHISAVERSGIRELREGQKVDYELVADRKSGKMSAENLKVQG